MISINIEDGTNFDEAIQGLRFIADLLEGGDDGEAAIHYVKGQDIRINAIARVPEAPVLWVVDEPESTDTFEYVGKGQIGWLRGFALSGRWYHPS